MSESENSYHSDSHVMASFGCLLDAAGFQLVCSSQSNRYIELFARVIGCVMKVVVRCESQTLCCKYVYIFLKKGTTIMILIILMLNSQWSGFAQTIDSSVRQNKNSFLLSLVATCLILKYTCCSHLLVQTTETTSIGMSDRNPLSTVTSALC